ncbi:response regulator transcription factor [Streptomyces sp. NPDC053048]|uniref:response regulator transcription factor n=1 Tax=Streptomyces sp. NPDC053048 TaxID=3365694 RepID=UPI0037CFF65F
MTTLSPYGRTTQLPHDHSSTVRVLVVDDEAASLAGRLSLVLRPEGWGVRAAADRVEAVRAVRDFRPHVAVLGLAPAAPDGLAVLGLLRRERPGVPVLFLASGDSVGDRVAGLTAGGDDFVTEPFRLDEVVTRLRGLLRRARAAAPGGGGSRLTVGDLVLDEESREVRRGDTDIHLTATEFELLRFLMRNPRRVLSKPQILERVWSYDFGGRVNVVELYISYLRRKIDAGRPPMIHTQRGAGYLIKAAPPKNCCTA